MLKLNCVHINFLMISSMISITIAFELAHHYSSLSLLDDSLYNYKSNNNSNNIGDNIKNNNKNNYYNNNDKSDADDINSSDDLIYLERKSIDTNENANGYYLNEDGKHNEKIKCHYVDLTDFIALIPSTEVQETVAQYYYQDKEVQRAFTYFQSKDFIVLKEKILNIHEVVVFLKYLKNIGFDAIQFMNTLVNLIGNPAHFEHSQINGSGESENITERAENISGLHGLVDSILDIFPQDQLLSMFFDKMETSEEFSKFIENIGSEEFNRILHNMENSTDLKMLVYTLHNNGIYVTRIVDSLKAYFFLG